MTVCIQQNADTLNIFIDDKIFNVNLARDFKQQFMEKLMGNINKVTLDLKKVHILDSIAVGLLVYVQTICTQEGINFLIVNVDPDIMSLIKQVKLDKILNIVPNFDNFDNA